MCLGWLICKDSAAWPRSRGVFVPMVLPAPALFQPLFPQQPLEQASGVSRRWGSPLCHPQSPLLPPHRVIGWHFRVSCFCPNAGAKGCGKPFFPAWQCPAPPSHNVCSSTQGGEAEAPGKGLLFKNFIFLPFLSTATAVSVLSPPPIMSCCLVQH